MVHLRIPYDACVQHISKTLHKGLQVRIVSPKNPGTTCIVPLENIQGLEIQDMKEDDCGYYNCLQGTIGYDKRIYAFRTHYTSYDAVLLLKNTEFPYEALQMVLPLTTFPDTKDRIYIPEEFTEDKTIVPIEFVWEFLIQAPRFLGNQ